MKIAVIGTGYVGLVSGVGLARVGHTVVCVDLRSEVVAELTAGRPTIYEEGLELALREVIDAGRISFSLPDVDVLASADVILIAVGTPSKDGRIDLSYIEGAAQLAGQAVALATRPISVIMKSTVVPGTTRDLLASVVAQHSGRAREEFGIGMNPEFLREGSAVADFAGPDRIVLGADDPIARAHLHEMYAPFTARKIDASSATAELIKYANNMLLALQISAANEIANLATAIGDVDPLAVMDAVIADARWGGANAPGIASYLKPGPGFGGSCFPKDVEALRTFGQERALPMHIAEAILGVNAEQPGRAFAAMLDDIELRDAKVVVLGLAFKPDTDDVRQTPSLPIVQELLAQGAQVTVHDPLATHNFLELLDGTVEVADDAVEAVRHAHVVVVPTPWREYRDVVATLVPGQILADPRRAYDPTTLATGVDYRSVGFSYGA